MKFATSQSPVDVESQENKDPMEIISDDKSDEIIDPTAIILVSGALQVVNRMMRFPQ